MGKQTKYTKSARGQECQVRIIGVCSRDTETTVLAHLNGGGMASKHLDIHGAYACYNCHAWLDGGYTQGLSKATRQYRDLCHLNAVILTQKIMILDGVLTP